MKKFPQGGYLQSHFVFDSGVTEQLLLPCLLLWRAVCRLCFVARAVLLPKFSFVR
jgi:hypothetical protein